MTDLPFVIVNEPPRLLGLLPPEPPARARAIAERAFGRPRSGYARHGSESAGAVRAAVTPFA